LNQNQIETCDIYPAEQLVAVAVKNSVATTSLAAPESPAARASSKTSGSLIIEQSVKIRELLFRQLWVA